MKKKVDLGAIIRQGGNIFAWALAVVIFAVLPLYFKEGYSSLASNKYLFFMSVSKWTAISFGSLLLIRACIWGFTFEEIKAYKEIRYLDIFVISFGIFSFISHLCSNFRTNFNEEYFLNDWFYESSLYGTKGWFMGLITYLCCIMIYFIISRCLIYKKAIYIPILGTATVICLWGCLNRYCIAPIDMKYDYTKGVFLASLGNINWLCGYCTVTVPLLWGLFMGKNNKWLNAVIHLATTITMMMIVLNSSDSGYLSLFVSMAILFGWSLCRYERLKKFLQLAMIVFFDGFMVLVIDKLSSGLYRSASLGYMEYLIGIPSLLLMIVVILAYVFLLIIKERYNEQVMTKVSRVYYIVFASAFALLILLIVINTLSGGALPIIGNSQYFTFNSNWGARRGETWMLGMATFGHMNFGHKLIGAGPDVFFYEMVSYPDLKAEWSDFYGSARLTNAHNEWITLLVNNGILGTATFIGMLVVAVKKSFEKAKEKPEWIGFALVYITYTANNMFSFQQITNIPLLFAILGVEAAALVKEPKAAVLLTKKDKKNTMQKGKKSRK